MAQAPRTPRFLCWLQVRLLLLILLAVSPAIALTIWGATEQRREAKRTAAAEVSRLARIAAGDQQHFVEGASQFLAALGDVPAVREMDVEAADSLFAQLLSSFPIYRNIGLMDTEGWIVASAIPLAQPINSSDRPFFRRAVATRAFAVGDYQIGRITKTATVNFARPVFARDGRVRGVLFVALGLDWLERLASQVDLPPGATLRVVDGNGTILARQPGGPEWVGRKIEERALLAAAESRPEGLVEETGLDGVRRIYAYATMSGGHDGRILVSAGYSKDVLYAAANRTFAWAIAVLVFVTVLAVFLAWLGGEALILRPVRSLAAAADRLRGGDLRARTGAHGSGEIGRLGRAFDEMAEALETRDRERRAAEERMREEQEFSTRLIESSMDGIVAIDRQYRITVWNAAMERITGLSRDQVLGRSPLDLFTFFEEIGGESRLQDVLAGSTVVAKDRPFFIPETDRKGYADSHYSPLRDEAGAIVGGLAIIHETTQRKKLEEQFRQAQKMESVGRLAGGVAHDFNNLLTAILGYADLLRVRLGPDHPARHDAEEIRRAGERAEQLTRQLLAFSRHQTFAAKVVDLNHLIAETERMLRRMIGEDVQLSTSLSAAPATVKADPGQIHQVIVNLVVNARDAMPDGGMVTIETQDVVLGEDFVRNRVDLRPGEYVLMAITDTGHGMDAETLSRIFEPFFTTKEVGRGTGLGLSTVYGIVKQSGGHVDVYSEVGIGTTFKIYLPRVAESPTVEPASPGGAVRTRAGTERVLLVEDEDLVRSVIREALSRAGYQVTEAANARDAIDLASRDGRPFDLLITDVVMPQTTGPDLAARLVDRDPNLDVLFMSGYMERAIVLHGVLKSNATFLAKPFSPEDLLKKVREVLDRRTGAPA